MHYIMLDVHAEIPKLAFASLAIRNNLQCCGFCGEMEFVSHFLPERSASKNHVWSITVNFNFNLAFIIALFVLLLVSYIFQYGEELQKLSDETLWGWGYADYITFRPSDGRPKNIVERIVRKGRRGKREFVNIEKRSHQRHKIFHARRLFATCWTIRLLKSRTILYKKQYFNLQYTLFDNQVKI